ncbi:MAG: hypothetical protein KDF58_06530 [Alphaproteobacteria bacterium]|nr:hypothetical protein [Alphaproteobacteria bacterium]HPF47345.1 hypothetical protein [Emcibacteraceae bacterium]HRW30561.1 hypothetical protein [Emcibacteraceae bacterium]
MSSVKKEARLSGLLLARKGTAIPAHTDHRLTIQALNPVQHHRALPHPAEDIKAEDTDNSRFVEAVMEINNVKKRQYNNVDFDEDAEPKATKVIARANIGQHTVQKKNDKVPDNRKDVSSKRIAMTLRMEQDDHLKLRIYAAHSRKSCQEIISAALEMYLNEDKKVCDLGECSCLTN